MRSSQAREELARDPDAQSQLASRLMKALGMWGMVIMGVIPWEMVLDALSYDPFEEKEKEGGEEGEERELKEAEALLQRILGNGAEEEAAEEVRRGLMEEGEPLIQAIEELEGGEGGMAALEALKMEPEEEEEDGWLIDLDVDAQMEGRKGRKGKGKGKSWWG